MALSQRLNLRLAQKTVLTPALKQALKLLQLQRLDLKTEIEQELLSNPCLEDVEAEAEETPEEAAAAQPEQGDGLHAERESEAQRQEDIDLDYFFNDDSGGAWRGSGSGGPVTSDGDDLPGLEETAVRGESLHEHLGWQLTMNESDPECRQIGEFLIGNLQENGYLSAPPAELAAALKLETEELEIVRRRLQEYDPPGCFATGLADTLLAQLRALGEEKSLAARLLQEAPESLAKGADDAALARQLGTDAAAVAIARRLLKRLDPEPGLRCRADTTAPPEPDLVLEISGDEFKITAVEDGLPRLRVSGFYRKALRKGGPLAGEERAYVRERLRAAVWFIKSLEERRKTIMKVAQAVIGHQLAYFKTGELALRPLILKDVAAQAEVHESTVSRVVSNKYILTPKGLLPLRFFFVKQASSDGASGLSALNVKDQIKAVLAHETAGRPLSDQQIAARLKDDYNVTLARRTVAKYREELGIAPAHQRRRAAGAKMETAEKGASDEN
jgi:RNA polymerase sigma-54 factor